MQCEYCCRGVLPSGKTCGLCDGKGNTVGGPARPACPVYIQLDASTADTLDMLRTACRQATNVDRVVVNPVIFAAIVELAVAAVSMVTQHGTAEQRAAMLETYAPVLKPS